MRDNEQSKIEHIKPMKILLRQFNNKLKNNISNGSIGYDNSSLKKENSIGIKVIDNSQDFLREYNTGLFEQYSYLYHLRLNQMRENLFNLAKLKWEKIDICKNVVQLEEGVNYIF